VTYFPGESRTQCANALQQKRLVWVRLIQTDKTAAPKPGPLEPNSGAAFVRLTPVN